MFVAMVNVVNGQPVFPKRISGSLVSRPCSVMCGSFIFSPCCCVPVRAGGVVPLVRLVSSLVVVVVVVFGFLVMWVTFCGCSSVAVKECRGTLILYTPRGI